MHDLVELVNTDRLDDDVDVLCEASNYVEFDPPSF